MFVRITPTARPQRVMNKDQLNKSKLTRPLAPDPTLGSRGRKGRRGTPGGRGGGGGPRGRGRGQFQQQQQEPPAEEVENGDD